MPCPFAKYETSFIESLKKLKSIQLSFNDSSIKSHVNSHFAKPSLNKSLAKTFMNKRNIQPLEERAEIIIDEYQIPEEVSSLSQPNYIENGKSAEVRDLERIMGKNDILPVNYIAKGLVASHSVCRIFLTESDANTRVYGTGFLISPRLVMTSSHVIPNFKSAKNAIIEFGCERDITGFVVPGKQFELIPDLGFFASEKKDLDFTIVAVSDTSKDGTTPLTEYGFLALNSSSDKIVAGQYASIIQHPGGDEKCISIRENKIIKVGDANDNLLNNYLWYHSDTAPGSSGAPVFNDFWEVVAIHHSGIPEYRNNKGKTQYQLITGDWISEDKAKKYPDDQIKWIANEGVRISKILQRVRQSGGMTVNRKSKLIKEYIDEVFNEKPKTESLKHERLLTPVSSKIRAFVTETIFEEKRRLKINQRPVSYYANRKGYDTYFLGVEIPLPVITAQAIEFGDLATVIGSNNNELKYTHFSILFNIYRKMPFYAAINIDGKKWKNIKRTNDEWFYDPRIPIDIQIGNELYGNESTKGWFDCGNIVRGQDPAWGEQDLAVQAYEDTHHWTNCSPQYNGFNQGQELWQGLVDYILYNTDQEDPQATVFSGPIFSDDDEEHRGILIPGFFWKVVAVIDKFKKLYSSAFLVSQEKYGNDVPFEQLLIRDFNHFQVPVTHIEERTGLKFSKELVNADVLKNDYFRIRGLCDLGDITNPHRK